MIRRNIFIVSIIFLFSRLVFLDRLPIFNDEALFMHLGADAATGVRPWWSALLFEGKPGYALSLGLVQQLPIDPLIASRLLSVVLGLITFITLCATYQVFFRRKINVGVIAIFILTPFLLFFNRMALAESAIVASSAGILYFSFKRPGLLKLNGFLINSVLTGVIFGIGWWWKASIFSVVPSVAFLWLAAFILEKNRRAQILLTGFSAVAAAVVVMSPLLRLPAYQVLPAGEVKSVYRLAEFLTFPVGRWWENVVAVTQWIVGYLSPGIVVLLIVGVAVAIKQKRVILPLFFFIPLGVAIIMGKILAARHIAPAIPAALLLAADGAVILDQQFRTWGRWFVLLFMGSAVLYSCFLIISPLDFYRVLAITPKAQADFSQYIIGWPSGYGVKEAVGWFRIHRSGKSTLVIVRTDSGNPEDSVFIYLQQIPGITVAYVPWVSDLLKSEEQRWGAEDIFFVSRGAQYGEFDGRLKEVARFKKPLDSEFVGIYQIQIKQ